MVTVSSPPSPFFLGGWGAALDVHPDGPGDEVGVFLDQVTDLPFRGVVVQVVLGVFRLEVQGDRRALGASSTDSMV